jgi:methionyl-tRNA formyltransferase
MILFAGYREWALRAFRHVDNSVEVVKNAQDLKNAVSSNKEITAIIFVGWSWIVPDEIINSLECVCFHPSDLPKYKGGSPIQNQVIDGITATNATLFLMTKTIDAGPFFGKHPISLDGDLTTIFESLSFSASLLIYKYIEQVRSLEPRKFLEQNPELGFIRKRRTPEESEITLEDILNQKGEALLRKILVLADPYPNAFIRTVDGKKLVLKEVILK